ncbi:uncharacterized protein VTP21DRAFT_9213 [Calcarisporiella thermophila]|uniref:uncharacterized protein n=1 Tax=Calcarisporiella thermophila TaxID=911321 RepID=UPI0037443789
MLGAVGHPQRLTADHSHQQQQGAKPPYIKSSNPSAPLFGDSISTCKDSLLRHRSSFPDLSGKPPPQPQQPQSMECLPPPPQQQPNRRSIDVDPYAFSLLPSPVVGDEQYSPLFTSESFSRSPAATPSTPTLPTSADQMVHPLQSHNHPESTKPPLSKHLSLLPRVDPETIVNSLGIATQEGILGIGRRRSADSFRSFYSNESSGANNGGMGSGAFGASPSSRSPSVSYFPYMASTQGSTEPSTPNLDCGDFDTLPPNVARMKLVESMNTVTQLRWQLNTVNVELERYRQGCSTLNQTLHSKEMELRDLQAQFVIAQQRHEKNTSLLTFKEKEITVLQKLLEKSLSRNKGGENTQTPADDELEVEETEAIRQLRQLLGEMSNIDAARNDSELEREITRLRQELADMGKRAGAQTAEIEEMRTKLARAMQEVGMREREVEQLRAELSRRGSAPTQSSSVSSVPTPVGRGMNTLSTIGRSVSDFGEMDTFAEPEVLTRSKSGRSASTISTEELSTNRLSGPISACQQERGHFRKALDKHTNADWQLCVDRIINQTDQQASIFLQQKLKCVHGEQKQAIFDAILSQAYGLMTNRFGNFLVQRCFEFGNEQQVHAVANSMRGNILSLACDPFGCHVVQKALDNVDEATKTSMVTEMFRKIPETITHKYASHVWQKIFEIRWSSSPPAVMTYVNNAIAGSWHKVALDETGSLVVQNIFENCSEQDKRSVIHEVLNHIVSISKGQWGNWVIQHIIEHGANQDREKVMQTILEQVVSLSMDQYASKVVEKALKTGSESVMESFIQEVLRPSPDRPRIPLIDIASDQYGNYIVQFILNNANERQREVCVQQIRKHMVSLRGSKYGQKVAFVVEKLRQMGQQLPSGARTPSDNV